MALIEGEKAAGVATLRPVLGDQLSQGLASLADLDPARDVVLMMEVREETTYVPHHPKKIAFILSAMRHFAESLSARGVRVEYVRLDDPANTGSFDGEMQRATARHRPTRVVATEPGEWRVLQAMRGWSQRLGVPVEIRADSRFICSRADFDAWAKGRRQLRMEHFYRDMRRRTGLLMNGDAPVGGEWNFDKENRNALPPLLPVPPIPEVAPDAITEAVLGLVSARFGNHFGALAPFRFAVTPQDAQAAFAAFCTHALPYFGDYQDAMKAGAPVLFHALIALYLNIGLLDPLSVCREVEATYCRGHVPLNAAEGFIRQIIGWREYVRGLYWLKMPDYASSNFFNATRKLPGFYWSGETDMRCMAECIGQTRREAYAHHIQRLMVTGNFALLAGIDPAAVEEWYLAVYADAFEWVELPNTHGMALFADGGVMASKPYAASGAYINRMSDYCSGCRYDVKQSRGRDACPFNYLYWNFMLEHRDKLLRNPRMALPLRNLDRMAPEVQDGFRRDAAAFLATL